MPDILHSKEAFVAVAILGPIALMLVGPIRDHIRDWANARAGKLRKE